MEKTQIKFTKDCMKIQRIKIKTANWHGKKVQKL